LIKFSAKKISRIKEWRVILYAKPGVGKTSAIKLLPGKTLVLDLDDSSGVLENEDNITIYHFDNGTEDGRKFDRSHPYEDMNTILADKDVTNMAADGYQNLVIDNISSFEKDWFVERGRQSKNGISNEIQDYSAWTNYFSRIMTTLYMTQGVNILTTAWEEQKPFATESGQQFNRYQPEIRDSVRDGLLGLADVVGRMMVNAKTGNRGVILEGNDAIFAKNRLDDRTSAPIEELFKFGGEENLPTPSVPAKTGKSGKK